MTDQHHEDDFDESDDPETAARYVRDQRAEAVAANDRFVLAMAKAVKRGREKVKLGTHKDSSPPINARRFAPEPFRSSCGSPSAMCIESAVQQAGAVTMK